MEGYKEGTQRKEARERWEGEERREGGKEEGKKMEIKDLKGHTRLGGEKGYLCFMRDICSLNLYFRH